MDSSSKRMIFVLAVISVGLQCNMVRSYSVETHRGGPRPRIEIVPPATTSTPAPIPSTTEESPENTLSELMELVYPKEDNGFDVGEDEGRGKKKKMIKRKTRTLFPVMVGLLIAKAIILPILLKALTIMSSASFVLSGMSLLTSVLLGFKWFLTSSTTPQTQNSQPAKVEIVHVPVKKYNDWDRETDHHHGPSNMGPAMSESYDNYYSSDHEPSQKGGPFSRKR